MTTNCLFARWLTALIPFAAVISVHPANGNHYILPCGSVCEAVIGIPIRPGITGTWFDPAQTGHGFVIEVLPGEPKQLLVSWFVFTPQGGQSWITGRVPIDGTRAVVQGYQMLGSGGRFPPNLDPASVRSEAWGTLTFTFTDCTHGHVWWDSTAPGYGIGHLDLMRLTQPAGLVCHVDGPGSIESSGAAPP
jgi:hypothetical protein